MVMVAVIGFAVALAAVKTGIAPLPDAASPMAALLFIHEKDAPGGILAKLKEPICVPGQATTSAGTVKSGTGFTVTDCDAAVVPHSLVTDKEIV